jgi:tetratricopeptide (TPR) repeat protein
MRVNELTSIEVQPPEKPGQKPQLELKSGAAYFFSREKPTEVQFRTPVASGAIRGTEFQLEVGEGGRSTLSLIDGVVELTAAQQTETLQSGEQGIVEPGQAPKKSALLNANRVIQWVLYYPAVVDLDEIGLSAQEKETFADSLKAYRSGDLLQALSSFPETRQPASDAERVLRASLLLAAGQAERTEADLQALTADSAPARALREMMATVRNEPLTTPGQPDTASEWMARSYSLQSRSELSEALAAARAAATRSPEFGATWIRVAELEFSFGRTAEALTALEKGLELSPRQAQGLALKGFLLAARKDNSTAYALFDQAVAVDGALGYAWLGRGLIKIRQGHGIEGRADLQVAATLEPQRSILRSYLGKAFSHTRDIARAEKELALARKLDPNDPTGWLYSALLNEQQNRINEAVRDLEKSKELNENRSLFRSRLLLDQDQAVRSANLAAIYRDAGMIDVSVQEAARAVNRDYGNYSAHLFLANSYDALRDPTLINLRYETPAFSELLVAQLLAPPGGGTLSQNISQQEYSQFFDRNHLGLFSSTEYSSGGNWVQRGSQYGAFGSSGYAFDAYYRTDNGQRPNNDLEQLDLSLRFKHQITPQDGLFFQVSRFDSESGDVAQYYNQHRNLSGIPGPSLALRVTEKQEPNLLAGYHREWSPGSHTLFLAGRFDDTFTLEDRTVNGSSPGVLFFRTFSLPGSTTTNHFLRPVPNLTSLDYRSEIEAYSAELQHIWQTPQQTLVVGGRYQAGSVEASNDLQHQPVLAPAPVELFSRDVDARLDRISVYGYESWQIFDDLQLTAGVSYDRLTYPRNVDTSPIEDREKSRDQVSPKAGLIWSPVKDTHLRAYYAQSLGGVFFDSSVKLEPTQIAGFNQSFRSLIPESVIGLVPGTSFETYGVGLDHTIASSGTYFLAEGQSLNSDATRTVGVFTNSDIANPAADSPSSTRQSLDYTENSLLVSVNQLLGDEWALGLRYKLTHSELDGRFPDLPSDTIGASGFEDLSSYLHQVNLYAIYQHRCGFFGQFNTVWSQQSNQGYSTDLPGDDFWQFNLHLGYRFLQRRVEAKVGLLNISEQDYRLNPLTRYNELPRERTFVATLKWYF